ncbi:MAG: hypothetical protein CL800_01010 [Citromicrobium sp.]|nr:hypothetical protein [Citromicrobium sp.]
MIEDRFQLRNIPVFFRRQQGGDENEGKVWIHVRVLGRSVNLDLRDVRSTLPGAVEKNHQWPFGFGIV